jgi:2-polyprenyl-6-methoxyphenol hydroxylase-like FAD-dependent oxidoreductase
MHFKQLLHDETGRSSSFVASRQSREAMAEPDRAIVIGASMAGLLAARVLSDHFQEVVIVERDRLPKQAEFRKGVPQSRHIHFLLVRGARILEQLFPGFREDLLAAGAQPIDWPHDALWLSAAGWGTRFTSGLPMLSSHRELLEWLVRGRVLGLEQAVASRSTM